MHGLGHRMSVYLTQHCKQKKRQHRPASWLLHACGMPSGHSARPGGSSFSNPHLMMITTTLVLISAILSPFFLSCRWIIQFCII
jgi:acid phosphatase family membrane protein YuiD